MGFTQDVFVVTSTCAVTHNQGTLSPWLYWAFIQLGTSRLPAAVCRGAQSVRDIYQGAFSVLSVKLRSPTPYQPFHCFHFCRKAQKSIWFNLSWADNLLFVAFSQITYSMELTVACDFQQVECKRMTLIPGSLVTHPQWAIPRVPKCRACVNKWPGEAASTGASTQAQLSQKYYFIFVWVEIFRTKPKELILFQAWIFFFCASEIALLKLPWFKTQQREKKGAMCCVIFCWFWFLRSFWSL